MNKTDITARILPDPALRRVMADGSEVSIYALPVLAPMTEAETRAAALADPAD